MSAALPFGMCYVIGIFHLFFLPFFNILFFPIFKLGNTFAIDNTYYYNYYNYYVQSSNLIKTPTEGSWILNAQGNLSLSVQILGFTGKFYHLVVYE